MLRIRFQGGPQAGQVLEFGDEQERIVIGRDPERCTVQLPADDTRVGREHCELRRELGRYSLVVNGQNPVWVDNASVSGSQRLVSDRENEIRLGKDGPILLITPSLAGTSSGVVLPPTAMHQSTPGVNTQLRRTHRASRNSLIAAGLALVLGGLGIAGGVAWYDELHRVVDKEVKVVGETVAKVDQTAAKMDETAMKVDATAVKVDETKRAVQASTDAIRHLDDLSAAQQAALEQMGGRLTSLSSEIEKLAPELPSLTRAAKESVYVVSILTPDGKLRPCGTAWVCDQKRGLLATNGHIGVLHRHAKQYSNELPDDLPLAVSSPSADSKVFEIVEATVHPGYDAFSKLWSRYDPARPIGLGSIEWVGSAGPACDVAVLRVKDPQGLAPALKLANDETLDQLDAGDPLGFAGYPQEGLSFAGVVVNDPTPPVQFGYVTSVTDYFGAADAGTERLLIQHSVPTAGGASGSPLLNARGEVVALHNASNTIGELDHIRVNTPANIHYAQRVSLLRELLGGHVDQVQTRRSAAWEERIAKFYQAGRQVEAGWVVSDEKRKLIDKLSQQGEFAVDVVPLAVPALQQTKAAEAGKPITSETSVELSASGVYLVAVMGQAAPPLELDVDYNGKTEHGVVTNKDDPACLTSIQIDKPTTAKLTARTPADDPVQLEVDHFVARRQSPDRLHWILVERWKERWSKDKQPPKIEMVQEIRDKLAKFTVGGDDISATKFHFEKQPAGHYLISLVADNSTPMQLIVDGAEPGDNVVGHEASWLSAPMERGEAGPFTGIIDSKTEQLGFSLRLYRATEVAPVEKKAVP